MALLNCDNGHSGHEKGGAVTLSLSYLFKYAGLRLERIERTVYTKGQRDAVRLPL